MTPSLSVNEGERSLLGIIPQRVSSLSHIVYTMTRYHMTQDLVNSAGFWLQQAHSLPMAFTK